MTTPIGIARIKHEAVGLEIYLHGEVTGLDLIEVGERAMAEANNFFSGAPFTLEINVEKITSERTRQGFHYKANFTAVLV